MVGVGTIRSSELKKSPHPVCSYSRAPARCRPQRLVGTSELDAKTQPSAEFVPPPAAASEKVPAPEGSGAGAARAGRAYNALVVLY